MTSQAFLCRLFALCCYHMKEPGYYSIKRCGLFVGGKDFCFFCHSSSISVLRLFVSDIVSFPLENTKCFVVAALWVCLFSCVPKRSLSSWTFPTFCWLADCLLIQKIHKSTNIFAQTNDFPAATNERWVAKQRGKCTERVWANFGFGNWARLTFSTVREAGETLALL